MNALPFLTARWENLAILSWGVDDALLAPHLPEGLELDRRDGRAFVSLVAFDFADTRVFGVRWPGHVNFPEINLRFYVRDPQRGGGRRGVCFIRELVPRRVVAAVARWVYNEPYRVARMTSRVRHGGAGGGGVTVEHDWEFRGVRHSLRVEADAEATTPGPETGEHWFKEHEWGYGRDRKGKPITYRVEHPVWAVHRIRRVDCIVDFASLHGPEWAALATREPDSVVLAAGSAVRVYPRQ